MPTLTNVIPTLIPTLSKFHKTKQKMFPDAYVKVGFSPSKKICLINLIESPLKMMKNAFHFILKALFILKIFKSLS